MFICVYSEFLRFSFSCLNNFFTFGFEMFLTKETKLYHQCTFSFACHIYLHYDFSHVCLIIIHNISSQNSLIIIKSGTKGGSAT